MNQVSNCLRAFLFSHVLWLTLLLAAAPLHTGLAQTSDDGSRTAEIERLLTTIENDAERAKLVSQLKMLLEAEKGVNPTAPPGGLGSRLVAAAAAHAKELAEQLTTAANSLRNLPEFYGAFITQVRDAETRSAWLHLFLKLLIIAVVGYFANFISRWLLARPRRAIEGRETDSLWVRGPFLLVRTLLDLVPVIAFVGIAFAILPLTEPSERTHGVITGLLNAYLIVGITVVIARMLMVPQITGLRVLPLSDVNSNYLFLWVRRFTYVSIYGLYLADAVQIMGVSLSGHRALSGFIGLIVLAMGVMFVLQNRQGFAGYLRGDRADDSRVDAALGLRGVRNRFADIWHALAIIYLVAVYSVWVLRIEGGFEFMLRSSLLTVLILLIAHGLTLALRRAVSRGFSLSADLKVKFPTLEQRANRYLPILQTILRWVVYAIAVLAVLSVWGLEVAGWLDSPAGRRFISGTVSIVIVLAAALVLWEGISSAIERYLSRAGEETGGRARRARARTLLPLLRNALMVVIIVMVALVILSELGINIGPLLAGAGVVGLAIGFGSQQLVRDVITGAFILFEDSVAVGDVVRVAGITGTVEALSIRSIRMRDVSGNVHTVPFSSVNEVTNMTKEFSYYLFEIGVAYRENVDEVMAALRKLGEEFEVDPEFGPQILEPLDIQGVDKLADSAVIIRARYKTEPVQQWRVGREFNRRIKNRFDELGIEIPFPHTTIYFGEDKQGDTPPMGQSGRTERTAAGTSQPNANPQNNPRIRATSPSDSGQAEDGDM